MKQSVLLTIISGADFGLIYFCAETRVVKLADTSAQIDVVEIPEPCFTAQMISSLPLLFKSVTQKEGVVFRELIA